MSILRSIAAPEARFPVPTRRYRLAGAGLLVALTAGLTGCAVDNTPESYNATPVVKDNFVATCSGRIPGASSTTILASTDYCGCVYDVFVKLVPYNDAARDDKVRYPEYDVDKHGDAAKKLLSFQALENALKDDPGRFNDAIPESVKQGMAACPKGAGPVAPVAGGSTGTATTVAPTTTVTPATTVATPAEGATTTSGSTPQ